MTRAERHDMEREFDDFVSARGPQLRRAAFLVVHDWHLAEDIVQSALIKVYLAWPRLERRGNLEAYTRRAVINTAISHVRKPRREVVTEHLPERATHDLTATDDLTAVLAELSPAQRAVIALRFLDDLSVAETAQVLNISEGTVKSYTARGLATLRVSTEALSRTGRTE